MVMNGAEKELRRDVVRGGFGWDWHCYFYSSFVTSYSAQTHNHPQLTKKAKATTASVKEFVDDVVAQPTATATSSDDTLGHKCSIKEIF